MEPRRRGNRGQRCPARADPACRAGRRPRHLAGGADAPQRPSRVDLSFDPRDHSRPPTTAPRPRRSPGRSSGPRRSANGCARSTATSRSGRSSTGAPAARRTSSPPRAVAALPGSRRPAARGRRPVRRHLVRHATAGRGRTTGGSPHIDDAVRRDRPARSCGAAMSLDAPPLLPGAGRGPDAPERTRSLSGRERARAVAGLIAILVLLARCPSLVAVRRRPVRPSARTDGPAIVRPDGAHALATLLRDRGVDGDPARLRRRGARPRRRRARRSSSPSPDGEPDLTPLDRCRRATAGPGRSPRSAALSAAQPGTRVVGSVDRRTISSTAPSPTRRWQAPSTPAVTAMTARSGRPAATAARFVRSHPLPAATSHRHRLERHAEQRLARRRRATRPLASGCSATAPQCCGSSRGRAGGEATDGCTPLSKLLPSRLGWAIYQPLVAVVAAHALAGAGGSAGWCPSRCR